MGFERVTGIIQGTKNFTDFANAKISNYETDIFRPIFDALEKLSGGNVRLDLPDFAAASSRLQLLNAATLKIDIAFRVIADHIRTLEFCDCRRHPAIERRARLRLAPHPAPRRALWPHARLSRTVLLQTRGRGRRHDGRRLPRNPREQQSRLKKQFAARKKRLTKRWISGINLFRFCKRVTALASPQRWK